MQTKQTQYAPTKLQRHAEETKHPHYYNTGNIEVWDAITDWGLDFLSGNVIKYIVRAGRKQEKLVDLVKARNYIDKLIEVESNKTEAR